MKQFDWSRLFFHPLKAYAQTLFWLLVFGLYILLKEYPQRMTGFTLVCLVLQETLELAIPSYSQTLLVLPFFQRGKWIVGAFLYLAQLGVLILGIPYILNGIGWCFGHAFGVTDLVDWRREHIAFSIVAFTIVASFFRLGTDRLLAERERKESELRHLRGQLNPHFLFNTLNNLYGLAVAESRQLPELMLKLSDLLRYSLYETNQAEVSLQKEIEYIANYVDLERIRLNSQSQIELSIIGESEGLSIAPLLLIVLVENCFKHFSSPRNLEAFVHIQFKIEGHRLWLGTRNSIDPSYQPSRAGRKKGGIGLENVRKRLHLIYPQRHRLEINRATDLFEVNLEIKLD